MKVTGIYTKSEQGEISPVDRWRIQGPFDQLKKKTEWDVEIAKQFLIEEDPEKTLEHYSNVDLVWSSYSQNKMQYALQQVIQDRTNCRFVLDLDDNVYQIAPHNPFWLTANIDSVYGMQRMAETAPVLAVTTERLADAYRKYRELPDDSVFVVPNFISEKLHKHKTFDNGDEIVIAYWGGSSHWADLNKTGFGKAIASIMRRYPNVKFELYGWWGKNKPVNNAKGSFIEEKLPEDRVKYVKGKRGEEWYEVFKNINADIACAPLVNNKFNEGKSNIKWQEAAMMGAAFIGSNIGPYADTVKHGEDGYLIKNGVQGWTAGLETLINDVAFRKKLARSAKKRVRSEFTIESQWPTYQKAIEQIVK